MNEFQASAEVRVGRVHLKVADLDRATEFYRDTLGFSVTGDARSMGVPAVFLAAGDYHHHIGLNAFQSAGGSPPPPGHTGLYHFALLYPGADPVRADRMPSCQFNRAPSLCNARWSCREENR